jgi:spermidine synthase
MSRTGPFLVRRGTRGSSDHHRPALLARSVSASYIEADTHFFQEFVFMADPRRWALFLASFLMLYFELVVIRWIPGHVRVLGYFTNFVLIACFFGMGVGMMLARSRHDWARWAPFGLAGLVALALAARGLEIRSGDDVFLFLEYEGGAGTQLALLFPTLVLFYLAIAAAFVPFGQAIGRGFGDATPLLDYSINLLGSMAGIGVFFLYSWWALPPWAWFLLGMPLLVFLLPRDRRFLQGVTLALSAIVVAVVWSLDQGTIWSPYQKIQVAPLRVDRSNGQIFPYMHQDPTAIEELPPEAGVFLRVNDDFYQFALNLSDKAVQKYPFLKAARAQYDLACRLKPNAERVLIVGGGSGNDAAAALRMGAKHIDVVDIDPEIVAIGRRQHPEGPYSEKYRDRVSVHIDDARHFFHHAKKGSYDVVVFALVDSHRLLSTLSSLRLDSYVFTVEAFEEARSLLKPESGIQVTAFSVSTDWMEARFYEMLRQVYGADPLVVKEITVDDNKYRLAGNVFVSGPGAAALALPRSHLPVAEGAVLATDDWPFVYARGRFIPREYLGALALILILSFGVMRQLMSQTRLPDLHFFCLGAGFLLLETKNVTTLALVFGSTWYVNSVVFFSILVMALLANVVLSLTDRIRPSWAYIGLFAALVLNYLVPLRQFAGDSFAERFVIVGGVTALPIFFSGIIFSQSFKNTSDPAHALGSNLLGGVCGGILEYLSMVMGLRFLFLPIAAFYALSLWRPAPREAAVPEPVKVA